MKIKSSTRTNIYFAAVLAVLVTVMALYATSDAVVASTRNATATGEVPFRALMMGSGEFTSGTTVEFHTTGLATHLGRFVATGFALLDPPTGMCPGGPNVPNVHTEALTAANGDELVIEMTNIACPTGPYTYHGIGHWTIIRGTGRLQNATGHGTNEGHADFENHTFEMAYTGTLDY